MMHPPMPARPRTRLLLLLALAALIILPVAWYLGSPLFINQVVSESQPAGASAALPARAAALVSGRFGDVDALHRGAGTATILTLAGGQKVLRLDEFTVTNGPDLYVYLSGHPAPRDSRQLHAGTAVEIARLKGNVGSQNYELPADLDLDAVKSVVVYCKQFSVIFSTATLAPAAGEHGWYSIDQATLP